MILDVGTLSYLGSVVSPFYEYFMTVSYDCSKIGFHRMMLVVGTLTYSATVVSNGPILFVLCGQFHKYFMTITYECSKIG